MDRTLADEDLMLLFQEQGSMNAFGELFRRHKDAFADFLTRLAGNRTIGEDVSQQAWLKLIEVAREGRYSNKARFRTYLYTIGRNVYIDEYQRKHANTRTDALGETAVADGNPTAAPHSGVVQNERRRMLELALLSLPFEQREVLALWATGTSIATMAEVTGAPRDTVLSRKKYGIMRLRTALADAGIDQDAL